MAQKTAKRKETSSQSVDRLFRIIECLAASRLPNRPSELSEKLELPQATVLRYLRTLCAQGYAYHDTRSGTYALTWRICRLGDSVKANLALRSMVEPFLFDLAHSLNVSACLVVEHDHSTVYLDFVDSPHSVARSMIRIGKNAPMHATSSGKVLLSSFSDRKVQNAIEIHGLERLTAKTITDREQLQAELETIRKLGYGIDDEECEEGTRCVSVPLYDYSGSVAAAISVIDSVDDLTQERIEEQILPALRKTAEEISYRLGASGPLADSACDAPQ